ncbi:MAG TPA: VOC family protein, partial [Plasticicumulans sp.]|nr:VOC family protein [Plasticicumulans sp.]HNJ07120.1 VOC family protein [Plasticicumulans sp.]
MSVKPIPDGYTAVTPYLVVRDAASLLGFIQAAFDAELVMRMPRPDGALAHAELRIGGAALMLGEACEQLGEMPASLYLYLPDVDAAYARALTAGATAVRAPEDMFYGDRVASVRDAHGNLWSIGTHIEDVPPEELPARA